MEPPGGDAVARLASLLAEDPDAMTHRAMEEGKVLQQEARLAEAEIAYRRALDILETLPRVPPQKQTPVLQALARVLSRQNKHEQAVEFYRRLLVLHYQFKGSDDPVTLRTMRDMARELAAVGGDGPAEAVDLCRRAAETWGRIRGQTDEESLQSMMDLVLVCHRAGRWEEVSAVRSRMLDLARAVAARRTEPSPHVTYRIAQIMERHPDPAPIEQAFRIAYQAACAAWGEDSFEATHRLHGMAAAQHRQGKLAEAEAAYRLSLHVRARTLGSRNPEVTWTLRDLARVLVDEGRLREAEDLCRELVDIRREVWGSDNDDTIDGILQLAGILTAAGEKEEAERCLRKAVECLIRTKGEKHARTCDARRQLGSHLLAEGRLEEAETELLAAQKGLRTGDAEVAKPYRLAMEDLLRLYERWSKPQLAAEWRERINGLDMTQTLSSVTFAAPAAR